MRTITVAELRQNPTAALNEVEHGESYVITRHRQPIARLVPVELEPVVIVPARRPDGPPLSDRPRRRTYEQAEALLREMTSEW